MSQPEASSSSQDSTGTQEIISQGSFNEIWESLGRTFSNPDKMIEGVLTDELPFTVEYKDQHEQDNIEFIFEQRRVTNQPSSPTNCIPLPDIFQLSNSQHEPSLRNGHGETVVNGTSTTTSMPYAPVELSPILPNTNNPGRYNFSLDFEPNAEPITKATPWVYVHEHQKLFVKMQCVCPIIFKINGNPPPGSGVRAILLYKRPENYTDIVVRCPNHKNTSKDDHPNQDHVMRCENPSTIYETCPKTGRLSIFLPLSAVNFTVGEGYFKELFKFTCFNSCVGGMNRRPTYILCRLECRGKTHGRAVVEVRICASPGRDSTEKESSSNQKNSRNTEKQNSNEPSSSTDIITPVQLVSSHSPGESPTTAYPRASVLMSTSKDPSSAPEPFQFPSAQVQAKKRQIPCGTEGFIYKKMKKTCPDAADDEIFLVCVRGQQRYEILRKINEGLHLLDGIPVPKQNENRFVSSSVESSQEFTKIQQKPPPVEIKKEKPDSSQCNEADVSPQSSQENSMHNLSQLSQLSRTSSNASSQSSTAQNFTELKVSKVVMKRTISLKKPPVS